MNDEKILYLDINNNFRLSWNFYWRYVDENIKNLIYEKYLPKKLSLYLMNKIKLK